MKQYLKSLWLTETVRLIEQENGRFQDEDVNRQVRANHERLTDRIIQRALMLAQQHSLQRAQNEWLNGAKISLVILFLIAIFTGAGLALGALAQNPVNLYWAILCLLGVHFITLFLWLFSCLFLPSESGSLFIQVWLFLTKKLTRKKTVIQLLPAFISLFGKQIRWLIGIIINLLWTVILLAALVILVALLSTKNYSFEWQSTLLSADAVITITRCLGTIPDWFGFTLPNIDMIRSSEQALSSGEVRSTWAIWLLGIFIVYGLLVRAVLFIFCWFKWTIACQKITLNTQYPDYQLLIKDLESYQTKAVIDEETETTIINHFQHVTINAQGEHNVLLAIEVNEDWLPPEHVNFLGFVNNNEQRKSILDFLQQHPVNKLLITIDTDRMPDRGIINLISTLTEKVKQSRIEFINQGRQFDNWQESIKKMNLEEASVSWLAK